MKDGIGKGYKEDHPGVSSQLFAAYSRAQDARALAGSWARTRSVKRTGSISSSGLAFEEHFIAQGIEENREIGQSLDMGWYPDLHAARGVELTRVTMEESLSCRRRRPEMNGRDQAATFPMSGETTNVLPSANEISTTSIPNPRARDSKRRLRGREWTSGWISPNERHRARFGVRPRRPHEPVSVVLAEIVAEKPVHKIGQKPRKQTRSLFVVETDIPDAGFAPAGGHPDFHLFFVDGLDEEVRILQVVAEVDLELEDHRHLPRRKDPGQVLPPEIPP